MPFVAIMDDIDEVALKLLKNSGFNILPRDEFYRSDAIIVRSATKVNKDFIDRCKNLKLIVRAGVGLDNIDVEYAKKLGIEVKNTPKATVISVAELTLGLMFSAARYIPFAHMSTKSGKWEKKAFKGRELFGKIVGIVGLGNIGMEVAKRCESLGMEVIYYDIIDREAYRKVELHKLFEEADIITLHLPLTPETREMVKYDLLSKIKYGGILINTSRGEIINTRDLIKFLNERRDVMVALDVYENDRPSPELLRLENVIFTPHIGAQTEEAQRRAAYEAANIIIDFFR